MHLTFTQEQIQQNYHKIELPDENIIMEGTSLEGEKGHYVITGIATIDGERYHDFQIEFQLITQPEPETIENIMDCDWDWYDFLF